MTTQRIHPVDEVLPLRQLFTFGLQHVLVMYAGAVAVPLILGSAMGLTSVQVVLLINANLLTSGIATLIQTLGFWKFGARLPLIQGCSFIALAPMIMIGKEFGLSQIFGAVIAAGFITIALAPVFSRLLRFFPPVVIGSLITIIGISLMPAAAIWLGGGNPDAADFGNPANLLLGLATVSVTLVIYAKCKGFVGNLSVLIGLFVGSLIAAACGMTQFSRVSEAAWFELSAPMAFGAPEFAPVPILIMTLAMLVIMAETTGNCLAIGKLTGKPTTQQTLGNAFRADGLSTMLGGFFNSFPYNAFTQNTGLIALSNVKSRFVVAAAGAIMVLMGLFPTRCADCGGADTGTRWLRDRHVRHDHGRRYSGIVAGAIRGHAQRHYRRRVGECRRVADVIPGAVRTRRPNAETGSRQRNFPRGDHRHRAQCSAQQRKKIDRNHRRDIG